MKKFLVKTFLVLFPVLLLVVGVNYFGDAANLFSNDYEYRIADGMLAGKNVTNVYNFDERLLQKVLVNKDKTCPDVVVLGSSRMMLVHSGYYPGQKLFNNSVSAASFEDVMALFQLYNGKGCMPKELVIGVDPHTFTQNVGKSRWKTLKKEYDAITQQLSGKVIESEGGEDEESKYWQLVSPSYFNSSFKKLKSGQGEPVITDNPINDKAITHHADGSVTYDKKYRQPTPSQIDQKAAEYQNAILYSIKTNTALSPEIKSTFESLMGYLKSKGCRVTLVIAPLYPKTYNFIAKHPMHLQLLNTEQFCAGLAAKYSNVKVIGTFNPAPLGMDESYFYDGNHCSVKGMDKLMATR